MKKYNNYFDISDYIGEVITEDEFQVLMAEGFCWVTQARFDAAQAARALGGKASNYSRESRAYGGIIIAKSYQEAKKVADRRGFNEEVLGQLDGMFPKDVERASITVIYKSQMN